VVPDVFSRRTDLSQLYAAYGSDESIVSNCDLH
jgi:hypothetical protein